MDNRIQEAEVARREADTVSAWEAFTESELPHVHDFLLAQARITALKQARVAEKYGTVAEFRRDLQVVIDQVVASTKAYFDKVTRDEIVAGWEWHSSRVELDTIARPFGVFLIKAGFDPGSESTHPGLYPEWHYYPQMNLNIRAARRISGLPRDNSYDRYVSSLDPLRKAQGELEQLLERQASARIEAEWSKFRG